MSIKFSKVAALSLIAPLAFGSILVPQEAHAIATPGMPTFDAANLDLNIAIEATLGTIAGLEGEQVSKDTLLDAIAWQMANLVLQSITKSIVNWINSGFNGSPAFVQDLKQNLGGLADAVAAEFIGQIADQLEDTPMRGTVEAIAYAYYLSTSGDAFARKQLYTLRDVVRNDRAFTGGDFNEGGWRGWFALTGNRANNPHGTLLNAKYELDRRIENSLQQRLTELGWGNGFLSWRGECADRETTTTTNTDGSTRINAPVPAVNLGGEEHCADAPIETPGSVIENQLNDTLAGGQDRLKVADEINEIVGALVSQLVSQALQGLSSIGSSSSGGSGYIDRATEETQNGPESIDNLLLSGIQGQIAQVTSYQTNLQKIAQAAEAAGMCTDLSSDEQARITTAKTTAAAELVQTGSMLIRLQQIMAEITQPLTSTARNIRITQVPETAQEYQLLLRDPAFPTAAEIADTRAAASDTTEPPSLYVELTRISARCTPTS